MSKLLAGRYELIEQIGEGGMAVVYKARCRLLNRYVAIKILRPEFTKDRQFIENFRRESQAAAGLQHPNIISVYDVGKEGDINFIVMELVDGRPLSDIIEEEAPMDYKKAIGITKQVASALALAHRNHIIHRDIKPHNIMITKDGIAKLGDFGIAKAVSNSTMVADTRKIIGSVHYFSPEQARGAAVDERSDIYSLGIVLYEMLTGRVPFDGENPVQVALMHLNDDIVPPSEYAMGIPPALENLVMKASAKLPSARYASADEMLEELENIEFVTKVVSGGEVYDKGMITDAGRNDYMKKRYDESEPDSVKKPLTKKEKKKIITFSLIGVVVVAAVVIILMYATGIIGGGKEVEVPELENMTYAEAEELLESKNLRIKEGESCPSDEIKKGHIVRQTPVAGTSVKEGKQIVVNISEGKKEGVVPNLVGREYPGTIEESLEKHGYRLGTVKEEESDSEKGTVISQNPEAGSDEKKGKRIDIVVSRGKSKPKVPSVTGMSVENAKSKIKEAGFEVGNISYEDSSIYKGGYVMRQNYPAGTELENGTKIDIVVAKEQAPEPAPAPEPSPEPDPNPGDGGNQGGSATNPDNPNQGE